MNGENIPIYGDGKNIRDWLYVLDHCKGIDLVYHTGKVGDVYNIGGRNERNNNYIADKVCEILDELHPKGKGLSLPCHLSLSLYGLTSFACSANGSNSSIRLLGQVGNFSKVSRSHAAGSIPLSFAVPSRV